MIKSLLTRTNYHPLLTDRIEKNVIKLQKVYTSLCGGVLILILLIDYVALIAASIIVLLWSANISYGINEPIRFRDHFVINRPEKLLILTITTLFIVSASSLIWYILGSIIVSLSIIFIHSASYDEQGLPR